MRLTLLGLLIVPISLIWVTTPLRLVQLALMTAVFEAGAAAALGNFGLPLAMVPGLLFILYVVLQYAFGMRYPAEAQALRSLLPLFALLLYALLSVALFPTIFAGRILVWPQKIDLLAPGLVPLAFSSGNVTQPMYLAMNVTMAAATALFLTRARIPYHAIIAAYLIGGYTAVGLALWQFASRVVGVPFPSDVLYSNPGWEIVQQSLDGVPRVQGPFSEPAGLALYLSGTCFCCLWLTARGYKTLNPSLLLALSVVTILLSTSTTGIITVVVGLPTVLAIASLRSGPRAMRQLTKTIMVLVVGCSIAIGPVLILKPSIIDTASNILNSTLSKQDSESFAQRSGLDEAAIATLGPSFGLGVGWGSFRASSLIPGILANAGVFGVLAVLWLAGSMARLISRSARAAPDHPGRILVDGFTAALCGQFCAALMSSPMIGSLAFYLQLGCVVGAAARMQVDARIVMTSGRRMVTTRGNTATV